MYTLRKKLKIVNRGNQLDNQLAMIDVYHRYVKKMNSKGWRVDHISEGDDFLKYVKYVHMYKLTKKELSKKLEELKTNIHNPAIDTEELENEVNFFHTFYNDEKEVRRGRFSDYLFGLS